jgi:hypothetical protein
MDGFPAGPLGSQSTHNSISESTHLQQQGKIVVSVSLTTARLFPNSSTVYLGD